MLLPIQSKTCETLEYIPGYFGSAQPTPTCLLTTPIITALSLPSLQTNGPPSSPLHASDAEAAPKIRPS